MTLNTDGVRNINFYTNFFHNFPFLCPSSEKMYLEKEETIVLELQFKQCCTKVAFHSIRSVAFLPGAKRMVTTFYSLAAAKTTLKCKSTAICGNREMHRK